jgi:3-methyladenine DNA glycosylase/8-oxoguanine DNA glycosylase
MMSMSKKMASSGKASANTPTDDIVDFLSGGDEPAESRSVASRKRIHEKVEADISRYLATGGIIDHIADHVTADPPKRPSYRYGQRPI